MQQVKQAGREVETMVLDDIAAWLQKEQDEDTGWILGPGPTNPGVLDAMGLHGTLLGGDLLRQGEFNLQDATDHNAGRCWSKAATGLRRVLSGYQEVMPYPVSWKAE